MPLLILTVPASDVPMYRWFFTLHGPYGILSTLDSGETQFVMGTEQAADVWTIAGEGVAARHALVRVAAGRIQVEDLAGGTLVNGHSSQTKRRRSPLEIRKLLSRFHSSALSPRLPHD
jgi:hypothetical protein